MHFKYPEQQGETHITNVGGSEQQKVDKKQTKTRNKNAKH